MSDFILGIIPPVILGIFVILLKFNIIFPYKLPTGINSTHSTLPNNDYSKYIGNHRWCSNALGGYHS